MIIIDCVLGFLVLYLWICNLSKADVSDISYERYRKVDLLYKAYHVPFVQEYMELKGYTEKELKNDSAIVGLPAFTDSRGCVAYPFDVRETLVYSEIEKKLAQLKADMKRGCEVYCKEQK